MAYICPKCGSVAETCNKPDRCFYCGSSMVEANEYMHRRADGTLIIVTGGAPGSGGCGVGGAGVAGYGGAGGSLPTIQPISDNQWLDDVSETKAWNMDEMDALVDREGFVHNLGVLLTQTREDVVKCELIDKGDTVVITFKGGATRAVNVHADSYAAIIRDVMKHV